ncbi:MAG TPA: hypothetical protein VHS34_13010 [Terriglobales bacterium]|jgi:hypothetical protein|nr:hypothetical protein [Terriglobales bacterium]
MDLTLGAERQVNPASGKPPDPAGFFDTVLNVFRHASAGRLVERRYRVGGKAVLMRFAGPAMAELFSPAIEHLSDPFVSEPDLTVYLFDDRSTGAAMPPAPWAPECHLQRGVIDGYNDDRFFTTYEIGIDILQMFDAERNAAIYWVRDYEWIPYWENSFPMRSILHWRFQNERLQAVHAGAVGTAAGGVLIAGKSGSGKSTTTLACLTSGLLYAGDDYVLADIAGEPYVHSLYSTAKLVPDNCDRFPQLRPLVSNSDKLDEQKALIYLREHFPASVVRGFPLRAILLPRVTGLRHTRLVKAGAMDAFRAIAPTTLLHLTRATEQAARKISTLCRALPVYWLEAGTDLEEIPRVVGDFLGSAAS